MIGLPLLATITLVVQSPDPQAALLQALQANRLPLTMIDGRPAGPGWDFLVQEARNARFTLLGEEHGVAETAQLSAALFTALRASGYTQLAIELSPPIAQDIESAARRGGLNGIANFLTTPGTYTFYNLQEEAQFLADVVKAAPTNERVLWGLDRELFSDRYLVSQLEPKVPSGARAAFTRLKDAQTAAWTRWEQTKNPDDMFILAADSGLASALRAAWPHPDIRSDAILRTLEGSLAIETAERNGGLWPYSQRRAAWMRSNLAALLNANPRNKIMMKLGYGHMIRGPNYVNTFDVGAMADEVASLTGDRAFHIIVLPGPGSRQAVPGGGGASVATDSVDDFRMGDQRLTRVLSDPNATGNEVIDLRPLRRLVMRGLDGWNADLVKTINGYDAAVIWKGAHAATALAR